MVKKWSVSYPAVNGVEQRRVYVYLPTMYEADPERRYPVLYMFDGQNVFFDADATYGKSWGVADYLDYTDTPLIVEEVVPKIQYIAKERNGWDGLPGVIAFGCSLGATHAVNLYLRFPYLFDGCLALSGIYTAKYGFGDYMDEVVYQNSPVDYMANFPTDHPYMDLYRSRKAVICCGQGAWEQPDTTRQLKQIFEQKGIPVWVDLWGYDVKHDWDWWYQQAVYYMPYILG